MIDSSPELKTVLEQDTTLIINSGCRLEYNMNALVDNITVTGAEINRTDAAGNSYQPFKKLFPVDTVVKPRRPLGAGIKYGIVGDIGANTYRNPRTSVYNLDYRTYYAGAETSYKYYVSDKGVGLDVTATYPKTIVANKIVIRFEISHYTPPTWTVYLGATQIATGTSSAIKPFKTTTGTPPNQITTKNYDAGTLTLYYNGTSWSTTEPTTPANPVNLTSLRVTTGSVANQYLGLIEISPRWVKEISDRIVDLNITKESSSSVDDILPVGIVSANSLNFSLVSYEDSTLQTFSREVIPYDKALAIDTTKTYLYKNVQVIPYFKIYHSAGTLTDSNGNYEKINQGVFYIDSWSTGEFGDITINTLDGSKILQETIAPSLVCQGYSTVAIIRTLLDSIGFTNYNFNINADDSSIFSPRFWWTDDGRTVWESIQQLCRDSQMVAFFDENNVMQFYTRENLHDASSTADWTFRYAADGNNLSNILSLDKRDLSSANQVKVLWNSVTTNNYVGNAQPLWKSGNAFIGALSVDETIPAISGQTVGPYDVSQENPRQYATLRAVVTNEYQQNQILNEYSGYLAIEGEIIEYDGIEYFYIKEDATKEYVTISNEAEALKYLGYGIPGSKNYQPNDRYRIKTRGAFNTRIAEHKADAQGIIDSWNGYEVTWIS